MTDINSATTMEIQIPSMPQKIGNNRIQAHWKTKVRRKEISAEVRPSFKAVKKLEVKIPNPMNPNDSEKIRNPETVKS